jgi:pre-mRNA-splicing factor CWC22
MERKRQMEVRQRAKEEDEKPLTEEQKQAAAKKEFEQLLNKRSGGVYVPPARLRALQSQIVDKESKEYQRMHWEALKKSINGLINKVNIGNIKHIVPELFGENLVRGQGLFCRSIMKAQSVSLPFTPIFAATAGIVNTKLPMVGKLLVERLVVQFRKSFKRNDKAVCISSSTFLAHLVNQQVVNELLIAQILLLLLRRPTDDSVEIAVNILKEVGQHLEQMNAQIALMIFDQLRNILHEASDLEKRTQYMIEVLFQIRRDKYKEYPAIKEELDLIDEEDLITHAVDLDGEINTQDSLNIFKFDPKFKEHEEEYAKLRAEILGEAEGSDDEEDEDEDESESEDEQEKAMAIKDQTSTDLINLRRSIYLTIKSSGVYEEAVHKLMKINLPPGMEPELISMIIECASQERTFQKFYGGIAERFCRLNRMWRELTQEAFVNYYTTIHRYETARLRIIAQLFGHLLSTDAINWEVLSCIHLNEEETTSSSRIFIKILFEELVAAMGMKKLVERLKEDVLQPSLAGILPTDNPQNARFAINFFTAINMGRITEGMREWLKNLPVEEPKALPEYSDAGSDNSRSSRASSYDSRSRSPSRTPPRRTRDRSDSRDRGRRRSRSYDSRYSDSRSRSRSYTPSRSRERVRSRNSRRSRSSSYDSRSPSSSRSRSRTPPRRTTTARRRSLSFNSRSDSQSRSRSLSRSITPPRGTRARRRSSSYDSRSRSPPPRRAGGGAYTRTRSRSYDSRRRSPSPRSARLPPRADVRGRSSSASRTPPRRDSRSTSLPRRIPRRYSSSVEGNRSPLPPRQAAPLLKGRRVSPGRRRRRNTSSPEMSASPPPRR